ncbi:MAG: type II toxin-antitoxin system PemK/MazF family toxin [Rhodanobacteraceae bacterium]|nr:type II toxin-antitoxin system PemK/MazF family toxin [Rhodanobacteraceae bacterium]
MVARWVPARGDIIWIDYDPQAGREMRSRHPMLVLSPTSVNDRTSIVIGLPMSSQDYNATNPFAVCMVGSDGKTGYILVNQPKSFDWRIRRAKAHPWKRAPDDVFDLACAELNQIIAIGAGD